MGAGTLSVIVVLAAAVAAVISAVVTTVRIRRKVNYMLDALEDGETNFRFRDSSAMNRTLNRLKTIYDNEMRQIADQEVFYGKMLDNVSTGILVVRDKAAVLYANSAALSMLGLSSISTLRQLERISSSLYEAFTSAVSGNEQQTSFQNEVSQMTVSVRASSASLGNVPVDIIVFNDISLEIEEHESVSWSKLIRVLTHEIMNTVSPISSLSDAMLKQDGLDIREGLETISSSSKGLLRFVDSYRALTHIPAPVRRVVYLKGIMSRVLNLVSAKVTASGAECTYEERSEDIIIYADEDQISQIIINIVKNAIQAGASKVWITSRIDSAESVIIDIANNGPAVSERAKEEIFVPFYTTKSDGTGLGLSISRQIMRLHNGSLSLTYSGQDRTVFTMVFR